ncbi:MAG TPA: terminase small subunit, partial [Ignavibacteria bacterium]
KETFPKMRAMTMEQLCFYLHCSDSYFRVFKSKLKEKDEDFLTVITDIETTIRTQKFQGASADLLNANIISRDLGLMDKSSVDMTTDLSNLSEEQLNYIANKLIKEQDGKQNR